VRLKGDPKRHTSTFGRQWKCTECKKGVRVLLGNAPGHSSEVASRLVAGLRWSELKLLNTDRRGNQMSHKPCMARSSTPLLTGYHRMPCRLDCPFPVVRLPTPGQHFWPYLSPSSSGRDEGMRGYPSSLTRDPHSRTLHGSRP
jgi:hypothetical protein